MKRKQPTFTAAKLFAMIDEYFIHIEGEYHLDEKPKATKAKSAPLEKKVWDREAEPPTITGLALFLGFSSRQAFDAYENSGRFAHILKRGRLRIEAAYEKKLHQQPASGAIFALKNMGWNEKQENKTPADNSRKLFKIEMIETGPKPASAEKEVVL